MSIRIIISDLTLTGHPENVRTGILDGYGSGLTTGECEIKIGGYAADVAYAQSVGAVGIVRSVSDLNSCIDTANYYYRVCQNNPILTSFAFLSNIHSEQPVPTSIPVCVTVGAGITENHTAFGNGLEFWDEDLDHVDPDLCSFSNGRVFGKLLKIKDTLNCSWWEARYRARMTASENRIWSLHNGYGKIDIAAAVAYTGQIIIDPYSNDPAENISRAGWRF